jgi:CO/xanthine dehydrogenase FAD-binding subunit
VVTFNRRLPRFNYVKPKSLGEALDLLKDNNSGVIQVYAGGTDVIPRLKARLITAPKFLMDLKGIPELDYIEYNKANGLHIGALATASAVIQHSAVRERFGVLFQGANSIASTQVQNRATIAGNLCNAVPSADSAPALFCLGATLVCVSPRGERSINIADFITGPRKTVIENDELLKEIHVPDMPVGGRGVYIKLSTRTRMDLALVGVAVVVAVMDGVFRDVRIGLGGAAPTPLRAKRAEGMLLGEKVGENIIAEAGRIAAEDSSPRTSHRASSEYRRLMVEVLVKRAIGQALKAEEMNRWR